MALEHHTEAVVVAFAAMLRERYTPSTRKTHRTVLRSWLRWLAEHGHLAEDFSGRGEGSNPMFWSGMPAIFLQGVVY
jgi:hypothetical protein